MDYFFDTNIILSCQFDVFKSLIISCQGYFVFLDKYFQIGRKNVIYIF